MLIERIAEAIHDLPRLATPCGQPIEVSRDGRSAWILAFGDAHFGTEFEIRG